MSHPYRNLPNTSVWRKAVTDLPPGEVDPFMNVPFTIGVKDKVATAGSCFAQHIGRYLKKYGMNYWVAESAHPIIPEPIAVQFNFGTFSARYGNIYTSRQLFQLFQRAFGDFNPQETCWTASNGRFVDPFRPQIQPGGFISKLELDADRKQHLETVRAMFEGCDIFIFTLGLTECWASRQDGAVYPLCPGVAGGDFDPARYEFLNLSVQDIMNDMNLFFEKLNEINARAKIILTVSPVPLIATAEKKHVLAATIYSKSVLRVASEMLCRSRSNVAYFPSYEIITGSFSRGKYFAPDLRSVTEEGVEHVMRIFMKHFAGRNDLSASVILGKPDGFIKQMKEYVDVVCDEEALISEMPPTEKQS